MALDLNATGSKVIDGSGGGTNIGDPLRQTVQISQTNLGPIPFTELILETAVGTTADAGWVGSGVASLISVLKSIALRFGVGGAVQDGSGTITTGGSAQFIFSGLTPVNGFWIQNNSSLPMTWSDVGVASPSTAPVASMVLQPGQLYETPIWYKPPGPISVWGGTSGQAYTARRS